MLMFAKIAEFGEWGKDVAEKIHTMSKRYRPVSGNKEKTADVRIIAATNEDMQSAVAEKRFRQDLYHRIKEYTLNIPPLRECHEDIMPLAEFFRELANGEFGKLVKGFNAEARKRMLVHLPKSTFLMNRADGTATSWSGSIYPKGRTSAPSRRGKSPG